MSSCTGCRHRLTLRCRRCNGQNLYEPKSFSKEIDWLASAALGMKYLENKVNREIDMKIKNVIFNYPATVVLWEDGTKTVVKCGDHDVFDQEKGLAMAIAKKALGNTGNYYEVFKKWCVEKEEKAQVPIATNVKVKEKDDGLEVTGSLTEEGEKILCKDCVYYTQIGAYCRKDPDKCSTHFSNDTCSDAVKKESNVSGQ